MPSPGRVGVAMARTAQIRVGVVDDEDDGVGYVRLPEDAEELRSLLYRVYQPTDAVEAMAVEAVGWAYADWRRVRQAVSWAGTLTINQVMHQARQAAAGHLRQTLYDLLRALRRRPGRDRWPCRVQRLNAACFEPHAGFVPWHMAQDGARLEEELLTVYRPEDPAEAMALSLVAYAHRDFQLSRGRGRDLVTDLLQQDYHQEAAWHLEDMVVTLRRIQTLTRRAMVDVVRVRRVETPAVKGRKVAARKKAVVSPRGLLWGPEPLMQQAQALLAKAESGPEMRQLRSQLHLYRLLSTSWSNCRWLGKSSTRAHRSPTPVVEECVVISVPQLACSCHLPPEPGTYAFKLKVHGACFTQILSLVPKLLPGGGHALEGVCGCGQRCRKLYLPPGSQQLACRRCHGLLYHDQKFNVSRGVRGWVNRFHPFHDMAWVGRQTRWAVPAGGKGPSLEIPDASPALGHPAPLVASKGAVSVQALARPLKLPRQACMADLVVAGRRIQPLHLVPVALPAGGGHAFECECACGRRCRKLYLSPDRSQLVCPRCHAATAEHRRRERAGARPPAMAEPDISESYPPEGRDSPPPPTPAPRRPRRGDHGRALHLDRELAGPSDSATRAGQLYEMEQWGSRALGFASFEVYLRQRGIGVSWGKFLAGVHRRLVVEAGISEATMSRLPLSRLQGCLGLTGPNVLPGLLREAGRRTRVQLQQHLRWLRGEADSDAVIVPADRRPDPTPEPAAGDQVASDAGPPEPARAIRRGPRSAVVARGLAAITRRTNLSTGLAHLSDRNAAKEMFLRLHRAGQSLRGPEIGAWADQHGWDEQSAGELAVMGDAIGQGLRPRIRGGPYWREDAVARLRAAVKRPRTKA